MAMGRGSCMKVLFLAFLIISLSTSMDASTTHVVGETKGWDFSVSYTDWAKAKTFVAGDTLVFVYQSGLHNVVPVNAAGYRSCKALPSDMAKAQSTGNDKFSLKKGTNYFMCSNTGHCLAGMKIQVTANEKSKEHD